MPALPTPAGHVRYAVSGPTASGRPDLVLLHGWCNESTSMATLKEAFGTEHRILEIDLRGHGESSRVEDDGSMGVGGVRTGELGEPVPKALREVKVGDYTDDLWEILRKTRLRDPILIGHSLGALIVLDALARGFSGPQAPIAGVLLDPAPVVNAEVKAKWVEIAEQVAVDRNGRFRADFANSLFLPTDTVARHAITETMARFRPAVAAGSARAIADFDGEAAVRKVTQPLLVLRATTVERQLVMAAKEAGVPLTTGQTVGAGHFHHLEVPEQVMPMIRQWMRVNEFVQPA
ncbi:alpha/beta hydrolase [Ornithinimicrobium sp. Arc0846-15]|nr:alpha/beta hydrolase [Ornithinimicrobium laminariae]